MRILFVAFPDSIHTARWINQVTDQGWDIHLVPSTQNPLHPRLQDKVTFHGATNSGFAAARHLTTRLLEHWPHPRSSGYARRLSAHLNAATTPQRLAKIIRHVQPDMIHTMVIQCAGYLTLAARKHFGKNFPTWINGNWGSNIYLFGRLAAHKEQITQTLKASDYYACECERDVRLAREFGFEGKILPVLPAAGGFDFKELQQSRQPGPSSSRRVILLKGYQNWAGRALAGLRAIELCADVIRERGYRVLIQLASPDIPLAAELVSHATGIPIEIIPRSSYEETICRFGQARVHIGLSISDGISQSLLESMVMGAFPIQSNTACANEWIEDGRSGLLVPPQDPQIIAQALWRALTDDDLVDQAVAINNQTVQQRLDYTYIQQQTIAMYKSVYAATKGS